MRSWMNSNGQLWIRWLKVYFEELRSDGYVAGRTDNNVSVKVKGSQEYLGTMAKVKITEVSRAVAYGEIVA